MILEDADPSKPFITESLSPGVVPSRELAEANLSAGKILRRKAAN